MNSNNWKIFQCCFCYFLVSQSQKNLLFLIVLAVIFQFCSFILFHSYFFFIVQLPRQGMDLNTHSWAMIQIRIIFSVHIIRIKYFDMFYASLRRLFHLGFYFLRYVYYLLHWWYTFDITRWTTNYLSKTKKKEDETK